MIKIGDSNRLEAAVEINGSWNDKNQWRLVDPVIIEVKDKVAKSAVIWKGTLKSSQK